MTVKDYDVVVFGGGSGLTTASLAHAEGKTVAVIEQGRFGGTCENRGCIPSKGLIQSADVLRTIREAAKFGIHVDMDRVRVDFAEITKAVRDRRAQRTQGAQDWASSTFDTYRNRSAFTAPKTLDVGDGQTIRAKTVFVCTGARPALPPIENLENVPFLTNEDVFELEKQPKSLLVLGGGYIGAELAYFFSELGTSVTVIEGNERLLQEDDDVRELFTKEFDKQVNLLNRNRAMRAMKKDGRVGIEIQDLASNATREVWADALLVATGRTPNTNAAEFEKAGIELDEKGFVRVNEYLETTNPGTYAFGDVIGKGMFKHTAAFEAELAWKNSQGAQEAMDYRANPHAIFSNPQVGSVGLREQDARAQGLQYVVGKVEYGGIAKGQVVGSPPGLAKVILEKETRRILGFHLVGPNAADLIHEVVIAMTTGSGTASAVLDAIHIHPTMSELVKEAFVQAK